MFIFQMERRWIDRNRMGRQKGRKDRKEGGRTGGRRKGKKGRRGKEIQVGSLVLGVSVNSEWQKENIANFGMSIYLLVTVWRELLTDGHLLSAKKSYSVSSVSFMHGT